MDVTVLQKQYSHNYADWTPKDKNDWARKLYLSPKGFNSIRRLSAFLYWVEEDVNPVSLGIRISDPWLAEALKGHFERKADFNSVLDELCIHGDRAMI